MADKLRPIGGPWSFFEVQQVVRSWQILICIIGSMRRTICKQLKVADIMIMQIALGRFGTVVVFMIRGHELLLTVLTLPMLCLSHKYH